MTRDDQERARIALRWVWRCAVWGGLAWVALGYALNWRRDPMTLEHWRVRVLLTFVGLWVGASIGIRLVECVRMFPKSVRTGLVALALSQLAYLILVWTSLKTHPIAWRAWWITVIATVVATHVMYLRLAAVGRRGVVEKIAIACAVATGVLLASLGLRGNLLADVSTPFVVLAAIPAAVTLGGSVVAWVRVQRARSPRGVALSAWQKAGAVAAACGAMYVFGFYSGRVTAPPPSEYDALPSALASLPRDELEQQVRTDLHRLRVMAGGIDELQAKYGAMRRTIEAKRKAEGRAYYTPAEDDQIRSAFMSYLAYRAGLLRIVATYAGYASVRDPELSARCFLVGYGTANVVVHASVTLVAEHLDDEVVRRKLNEADPRWGMPAGMFDRIYEAVGSERNAETFEEMAAYFGKQRSRWRDENVLPPDDLRWLEGRIDDAIAAYRKRHIGNGRALLDRVVRRVKDDAYSPIYATQSVVSTWIGDVRMVERPPFIAIEQIKAMQRKLQPGDIFLERRNWFFSNAFLPGFWPHAAMYVGTIEDLEKMGLVKKVDGKWTSEDAEIRRRLEEYLAKAPDGESHTVIESVSEGVIFNSLTESMHADYVAVLRPRLGEAQKAQAIARAFAHQGKPYDFEFDFFSSDKLVCTELVYRSYEGLLHFPLVHIMGRDTLPALEICRKYGNERGRADRELDFVMFLDTKAGASRAELADEEAFVGSAARPKGFNE